MKKTGLVILLALIVFACAKENENTMYVKASVKGLKKGTFYLQKQKDSTIISVDSISVNGTEEFMLTDEIETPEMYYLTLKNSPKRISFFGEKDTVTIKSQLELFGLKVKVQGSQNQELLDQYNAIQQKFNNQRLDLIKQEFEARKTGSQDSIDLVAKKYKNWERKKYLYTTNFAITNGEFEVAPYIALTDLVDANLSLLDTVNNSLSPEVKQSKYGIQLAEFVEDIKKNEK